MADIYSKIKNLQYLQVLDRHVDLRADVDNHKKISKGTMRYPLTSTFHIKRSANNYQSSSP